MIRKDRYDIEDDYISEEHENRPKVHKFRKDSTKHEKHHSPRWDKEDLYRTHRDYEDHGR